MIVFAAMLMAGAPADCPDTGAADMPSECALQQSLAQMPELDCAADDTQSAMNVCSYRESLRADIALNNTWKKVAARHRNANGLPGAWNAIVQAQRAWLAYRDAECEMAAGRYEGGSIAPLIKNTCLTSLTSQRTQRLTYLLEDY